MGLSAPFKRNIPESLLPEKSDRLQFLKSLKREYNMSLPDKRNKLQGKSFTVAILIGDACERQMRELQLSKNETDQKNFARYMSDEFDSLPLRITVPTIVYWMDSDLGVQGYDYPPDHPAIKSKCASFYSSGSKGYFGFFDKLKAAKIITKQSQIGASGAVQDKGRSSILIWLSKDFMMGSKYLMTPEKFAQNAQNNEILEEKGEILVANEPLFLDPKTGNSCQNSNKKISTSNEVEIFCHLNIDTKQSGEKKSSHCANVKNSTGDDFFSDKKAIISPEKLKDTEKTALLLASAKRPEHAIPPPRENFDDAERIQSANFLAETAKNVAEKLKELYEIALEKGQVRGSMQKIFNKDNFEKWNWAKIQNAASDILQALRKEGELWAIVGERALKTIEKEVKRLRNPEKYIMLPVMYLNTAKNANGEWVMIRGSLVAWHDFLSADNQLNPQPTENDTDFNEYYKKSFGNACKILKQLGLRQAWITKIEQQKNPKDIVEAVKYCLEMERDKKIRGSLKAYMMQAVNNCGWNHRKIFAVINRLKGNSKEFEYFLTKWADQKSRVHLLQNVARYANSINNKSMAQLKKDAMGWYNWVKPEFCEDGIIHISTDEAIFRMAKEAIQGLK